MLDVKTGLMLPALPEEHRLRAVVASAVARDARAAGPSAPELVYWDAMQFDLHKTRMFVGAAPERQTDILAHAGRSLLEEAYFIEKSGLAFTAKMCLLSETTEERMLYGLFGGDEAAHLYEISGYLARPPDVTDSPFLRLLSNLIEDGDRDVLVFTIQVVLEGWGMTHYRSIASTTHAPALADSLNRILKDEARHHGSGMLMFDESRMSTASRTYASQVLVDFLGLVRAGPQSVVRAVENSYGGLTNTQRVRLFRDLGAEEHSASRLRILRGLMLRAGAFEIVSDLEERGAFRSCSAEECAA